MVWSKYERNNVSGSNAIIASLKYMSGWSQYERNICVTFGMNAIIASGWSGQITNVYKHAGWSKYGCI